MSRTLNKEREQVMVTWGRSLQSEETARPKALGSSGDILEATVARPKWERARDR